MQEIKIVKEICSGDFESKVDYLLSMGYKISCTSMEKGYRAILIKEEILSNHGVPALCVDQNRCHQLNNKLCIAHDRIIKLKKRLEFYENKRS